MALYPGASTRKNHPFTQTLPLLYKVFAYLLCIVVKHDTSTQLRATRNKIGHFGDALPSQSLG